MKKSGLADSPFFTIPKNDVETPLPVGTVQEAQSKEVSLNVSPAGVNPSQVSPKSTRAYAEENQVQFRTNVRPDERTDIWINQIHQKRQKIRHAFDIYQDQLMELQLWQLKAVQKGKRKPKLGKMVQEALDVYLKRGNSNKSKN